MKKYLLILICCLGLAIPSFGQTQWYRTTAYAQATIYNGYYTWGAWQNSNMDVCINLVTDRITIYSPKIQIYRVYGIHNNGQAYTDSDGGTNIKFYVIDQDNDRGNVRLRIERNGNSQIYVEFSNVAWVYNVVRTR